jgi:lipopolysaccharide biosynthesis glycosyltransferase
MEVERFLYLDADILCDADVSELQTVDMGNAPAGWVPEAPMAGAADRNVAEQLGNSETEFYFNAGVMLVNVPEWRRQKVTERALEYIARHRPVFHDPSGFELRALPECADVGYQIQLHVQYAQELAVSKATVWNY